MKGFSWNGKDLGPGFKTVQNGENH